jgi:hypothetical protein
MADTLNREEAREQFRAVSRGRSQRHTDLNLVEAKARLREVDADLDLGPTLRFASRGQWRPALLSMVAWSATGSGRAYLAPLLLQGLEFFYMVLGSLKNPGLSSSTHTQATHTAAAKTGDE